MDAGALVSTEAARRGAHGHDLAGHLVTQAGERRSAPIESLRALAALAVLVSHAYAAGYRIAGPRPGHLFDRLALGGGNGVFLFFVLSGYLLYWPFARRDFGAGGAVDLGRYARNRALRILPLYYVVVVVVLALHARAGAGDWARFLTFSENFSVHSAGAVIPVAWSLVVELHFYVVLPFLALAVRGVARGSHRRAAGVLLAMLVGSFALRAAFVAVPATPDPRWVYSLPVTVAFFATGMLVALGRAAWEDAPPRWLRGALTAPALWLGLALPLWVWVLWRFHHDADPVCALAAGLTVAACALPLDRRSLALSVLSTRPLVAVGVASYSLYLWHWHVIDLIAGHTHVTRLAALAVFAASSTVVAGASYLLVERPFLRLRRRWSPAAPVQRA